MQGRVFDKLLLFMLNRKKIIEEPIWKFHMQIYSCQTNL